MSTLLNNRQRIGKKGEAIARLVVERAGMVVVAQNVHTRYGELDVVASDGSVLHIIEVKTRSSDCYGTPEQSVTPRKLLKIRRAVSQWFTQQSDATHSIVMRRRKPSRWQIDVMAITLQPNQPPHVTWYRNVGVDEGIW